MVHVFVCAIYWMHNAFVIFTIGLATKSFRFFPLDKFNRSKPFFSIANNRPYTVFDSWRFIDYSVKNSFKFCCLFIVLHWFEMEIPDRHFRHILLYYFWIGKNGMQAWKKLYDVYGEKSLTERQCQNWFARFHSGGFDLKDAPRFGRPTEVDDEIAEKLNISHTCVKRHLKQLGYVNKLDIWVSHNLIEIQLAKVVDTWCRTTGLSVNPDKTDLVIFTRRYKWSTTRTPPRGWRQLVCRRLQKQGRCGGCCLWEDQRHKPRGPVRIPLHTSSNRDCGHTPMRMRSTESWPRQEHPHMLR